MALTNLLSGNLINRREDGWRKVHQHLKVKVASSVKQHRKKKVRVQRILESESQFRFMRGMAFNKGTSQRALLCDKLPKQPLESGMHIKPTTPKQHTRGSIFFFICSLFFFFLRSWSGLAGRNHSSKRFSLRFRSKLGKTTLNGLTGCPLVPH